MRPKFQALFLAFLGLAQCESARPFTALHQDVGAEFVPMRPHVSAPSPLELERKQCELQLRSVLAQPEVPGSPTFAARRLEILTRAKAEPVILTGTPTFDDVEPVSALARGYRRMLANSKHPWGTLELMLPKFMEQPGLGRAVVLRQGYLFSDNPEMAYALVSLVSAEHLFGHDKIWIKRGESLLWAERKQNVYVFTNGPNQGERVRLLLLDRLGFGPVPSDTFVRDFRSLKYRLGFDRAHIRRVTDQHIVADLKYGELSVPSVLRSDGAHLELSCEVLDGSRVLRLEQLRQSALRRQKVVQALRVSMQGEIEDQLPFDEPRREYGFQLDGKLRKNWYHAYSNGQLDYALNGDRYYVYNSRGKPLVPQVCVDFLTDTFERVSGTWWTPKGEPPRRVVGKLNYDVLNLAERTKLRRVPGFLSYAAANPEQFEVLNVPSRDRIGLGKRAELLQYLVEHNADYQAGDIIVIRGKTPWDPVEMHYHSFFVYENDPISGIPLALVGNAGRPSVRYWEVEARRTPARELWHRVRPRTPWLESIVADDLVVTDAPPPLSPRGNSG